MTAQKGAASRIRAEITSSPAREGANVAGADLAEAAQDDKLNPVALRFAKGGPPVTAVMFVVFLVTLALALLTAPMRGRGA